MEKKAYRVFYRTYIDGDYDELVHYAALTEEERGQIETRLQGLKDLGFVDGFSVKEFSPELNFTGISAIVSVFENMAPKGKM
jgi:hypothetical protein